MCPNPLSRICLSHGWVSAGVKPGEFKMHAECVQVYKLMTCNATFITGLHLLHEGNYAQCILWQYCHR